MAHLRFADPEWLLALILLPLLLYRYLAEHRRARSGLRFSDLGLLQAAGPTLWTRLRHCLIVFKLLGLACLVLAMARPQAGRERRELSAEGVDILLTLDVSSSMEAKDLGSRNRLEIAKEVVAEFIRGRHSDRLGLVVFAGESFTQCPLTLDYDILLSFIQGIQIADDSWDGTAIGMALANACNRLRDSQAKSKVVVLLTDGVNNAGELEPLTAADAAAAVGIRVYAIGVGSNQAALASPLLFRRAQGAEFDEATLQEVARRTGGKYFRATSKEKLQEIYREIAVLETTPVEDQVRVDYAERFAYFLWPGLALLLGEVVLANTRFRRIP
ncbi:MAG: VWA domain-containing protein [Candidatus Latescibacteria bacterium]|nr:VWA domain-containing protein [Candidatus Latescibacterota bacterium]